MLLGCVACDGMAVLALMGGSLHLVWRYVFPMLLGCVACDWEAVLALVRGSFVCHLVLCLSYVARLFGLRWGGGASIDER